MQYAGSAFTSVSFDAWKSLIRGARDIDEVVRLVRMYLSGWRAEDLNGLPMDVASTFIELPDDIFARAVLATRAEITASPGTDTRLLREMSLTLSAAATRLRQLAANNSALAGCP